MTFTLDETTAQRIDRTARRLGIPKSGVVREAIADYSSRVGKLSDRERQRLLEIFDAVLAEVPRRSAAAVDREVAAVASARRKGGRRSGPER